MAEKPRMISGEYVTVEIYDQLYHLSGQDPAHIRELAAVVDAKMRAVAAQGRTADSLRVAVLAALNLADEVSQATSADLQLGHVRANTLRMLMDEVLGEKQGSGVREQGTEKQGTGSSQ
ncbi:MAG: cell division protein ZapA [Terracidiphilus sp.]